MYFHAEKIKMGDGKAKKLITHMETVTAHSGDHFYFIDVFFFYFQMPLVQPAEGSPGLHNEWNSGE